MSLLQVEVVYDGEWHGSIVEDNSAYQIEGFGSKTLNIMNSSKVSVAISKKKSLVRKNNSENSWRWCSQKKSSWRCSRWFCCSWI